MHRISWQLTGVTFVLIGSSAVLHAGAAIWAFMAGPGTVVYDTYLRWAPVGNHSRTVGVLAYACLLLWVIRSRASLPHGFGPGVSGLLLLGMLTGGAIGWWEGSLIESRHWSAFAFLNLLSTLLVLAALFGALLNRTMDWHLWLTLAIFALHLAFNVIWFSALAWAGISGVWSPSPWQIQMYAVIAYGLMLALALHRLVLARQRVRVASALEFLERPRFSSLG